MMYFAKVIYNAIHRPPALATICLAEFVATYRVKYGSTVRNDDDNDHNHDNESIHEGDGANLREIKLLDGFGTMTKRKSEAVISFFKFSKDSDATDQGYCCTLPGM